MRILSAQAVAIQMAKTNGTLRITEEFSERLSAYYWAVSDENGLIQIICSESELEDFKKNEGLLSI